MNNPEKTGNQVRTIQRNPAIKYEQSREPAIKYEQSREPAIKYEQSREPAIKYEQSREPAIKYEQSRDTRHIGYTGLRHITNTNKTKLKRNTDRRDMSTCGELFQ